MVLELLVGVEAQASHHELVKIHPFVFVLIDNLDSVRVAVDVLELGSVGLVSRCLEVEEGVHFDLDAERVRRALRCDGALGWHHLSFVAFLGGRTRLLCTGV